MTTVFKTTAMILAAGEARRFNGVKKQLLRLEDGYTIISRIIKQCQIRGVEPFVITHDAEIGCVCQSWYIPPKHSVTCETLLSTKPLWNERTIVLLGDVVYSKKTMDIIFNSNKGLRYFGDIYDIMAITFVKRYNNRLERALIDAIKFNNGKLRFSYRSLIGVPMGKEQTEQQLRDDEYFCYIDDWTHDVDMPSQYQAVIREQVKRGLLKQF